MTTEAMNQTGTPPANRTPHALAAVKAARARVLSISISTKQSVEISHALRYRNTAFAKRYLERVLTFEQAVPFRRYNRDMGHKPGMAAGRYPQKAARAFLQLIKAVEANAQVKGLAGNLKITRLLANKASAPMSGGRRHRGTKRTHLEVEVQERPAKRAKKRSARARSRTKTTTAGTPSKPGEQQS